MQPSTLSIHQFFLITLTNKLITKDSTVYTTAQKTNVEFKMVNETINPNSKTIPGMTYHFLLKKLPAIEDNTTNNGIITKTVINSILFLRNHLFKKQRNPIIQFSVLL